MARLVPDATTARRMRRLIAGLIAFACIAITAPTAAAAPPTTDCDAPAASRVLVPAHPRADARAYWLDAATLRWPGKPADGHYRLVGSDHASLHVDAAGRVAGIAYDVALAPRTQPLPADVAAAFAYTGAGIELALAATDATLVRAHVGAQWWLVDETPDGRLRDATHLQLPGLLDAGFDASTAPLGARVDTRAGHADFALWAPTAQAVALCTYAGPRSAATSVRALLRDDATGVWTLHAPDLPRYFTYLVDVYVPGAGTVRNRVTDPYSVGLAADGRRSALLDLDDSALMPPGWSRHERPAPPASDVDMTIYELHVRDFSVADTSVPIAHRGRYLAFTDDRSNGMRHLHALRAAGLTDIHLLPVFDFASVPERGCLTPEVRRGAPDGRAAQAAIAKTAARDCYNWGYDPLHFGTPEGSYASDADGGARIREFRAMVQALHAAGLRVGMDVVYNHTHAAGQAATSVLDRIVPGYYPRLDARGVVERSTCCANTATEHRMMARLMVDTLVRWARDYGVDSFRFDLMGHQPRAAMEAAQAALRDAVGHDVPLIGEGWNFGEVANGARFVQAAQGRLDGTDIGTFSDRTRDALRGGGCCDSGDALLRAKGWLNGLADVPDAHADALHAADLVRAGLAGTLRDYATVLADGRSGALSQLDYAGQPAGYAAQPTEVVNYVENHDGLTLFDVDALRLPADTSREDRARVQALGIAIVALSQGVPYYHAGIDLLRSKSLDRNSFDSGDAFNRLDWTYADNGFGIGLPAAAENARDWPRLAPVLRDPSIRPTPRAIAWTRDVFRDWLRIRASTPLLRLRDAADVQRRLVFRGTGPSQDPAVIVGHLDGAGLPGTPFREVLYVINAAPDARTLDLPDEAGKAYVLHPVQCAGADARVREARFDPSGRVRVPGRTAAVFVLE